VALVGAAGIVTLYFVYDGTKNTPFAVVIKGIVSKLGWGKELIIPAHPLAAAIWDLDSVLSTIKTANNETLATARERFLHHDSAVRVALVTLKPPDSVTHQIADASKKCMDALCAPSPDKTACRDALAAYQGALTGLAKAEDVKALPAGD
jgi:hypothetical protein